jgi:hypothetical protein
VKKRYKRIEDEHGVIKDAEMRSLLKALYEETAYDTLTDVAFIRLHNWIKGKCLVD